MPTYTFRDSDEGMLIKYRTDGKVFNQPKSCTNPEMASPNITVNGEVLNNVDKFTYLGKTLSCQANIDEEVKRRIAKASSAFGKIQANAGSVRASALAPSLRSIRL